jgi:hypothetical protein
VTFDPAADRRTCAACGEPVAPVLRGFMESLLACAAHLDAWSVSPERQAAAMPAARRPGAYRRAFNAWASAQRRARLLAPGGV